MTTRRRGDEDCAVSEHLEDACRGLEISRKLLSPQMPSQRHGHVRATCFAAKPAICSTPPPTFSLPSTPLCAVIHAFSRCAITISSLDHGEDSAAAMQESAVSSTT
jgi:hypothetical protein